MSCLMLSAALLLGADPQQRPPSVNQPGAIAGQQGTALDLDGTWMVLFAENAGQKLSNGRNETVQIHGNILTWEKEGKTHRVHLQLGANHQLTAWPENAQPSGSAQSKTAEHQQAGTVARPGQAGRAEPKPGEEKQTSPATGTTAQKAAEPKSEDKPVGLGLPAYIPGQIPGPIPGRLPAVPGQANMAAHSGVYIFADEYLCLSLNQGFTDGMQEQAAPAATKPGTPPAHANQPTNRPGQVATPAAPGTSPATNPQTGTAATNRNPASAPIGRAATQGAETAAHPAAVAAGQTARSGEFVLILHREKAEQHPIR